MRSANERSTSRLYIPEEQVNVKASKRPFKMTNGNFWPSLPHLSLIGTIPLHLPHSPYPNFLLYKPS